MKVIVVGINHAGTSAIRTMLAENPKLDVVAFDRNDNISFLGCGIALAVSGVVKDTTDLFYSNPEQLRSMGAKVHMKHEVLSVDHNRKVVVVRNLEKNSTFEESYDKLILATGAWPITTADASLPFTEKYCGGIEGLVACKTYQHALEIIDQFKKPDVNNIVVIGAGYIGVELVEAAHQKGKKTLLVDMLPRPAANYFDKEFGTDLMTTMKKEGVDVRCGTKVMGYLVDTEGGKKVIRGITLEKDGVQTRVEADLVIQCIGFLPNTSLLADAHKVKNGALIIDQYCQTSVKDVYAIGGAAAIMNAATGEYQNIDLATNAVKTGVVAASHINGMTNIKLENVVGTNAIHVFGHHLASTGISEEVAKIRGIEAVASYFEDADRPEWMNTYDRVKIKLVYDPKTLRLLGAQVGSTKNNHSEVIYLLALAIQRKLTLVDVAFADVFFLPHYNKPFNFIISAILQALGLNYFKESIKK
ncbi:FAD-dependent oxidoreductase [Mycoplasmoides gallisepticum]|nr:FAD-dependent oxidoreductase [Mycoplasmoides gallisepticum]